MTGGTRVTVLVISWNCREALERCLAALAGEPHNVLVVDNASSDGTAAHVAAAHPEVTLVRADTNLGFAAAVNLGVGRSTSPFVLLLNPDTQLAPGAVDRLVEFLDAHPGHAGVAGSLVNADGTRQRGFNLRRFPTLASLAAELLLLDHLWPTNPLTRRYRALDLDLEAAQNVDQPAAACLLVRRVAFEAVGGMDTRFFPAWFEDVDFCRRLHDAGWRLAYLPTARCLHEGGISVGALGRPAFSAIFYRNMHAYVRRHHGRAAAGLVRVLIVVGMAERWLAARLSGDGAGADAARAALAGAVRGWSGRTAPG
jgi:GT2 family glycosyltransferase